MPIERYSKAKRCLQPFKSLITATYKNKEDISCILLKFVYPLMKKDTSFAQKLLNSFIQPRDYPLLDLSYNHTH